MSMLQHYLIGEETAEKPSIVNQKGGVAKTTSFFIDKS